MKVRDGVKFEIEEKINQFKVTLYMFIYKHFPLFVPETSRFRKNKGKVEKRKPQF